MKILGVQFKNLNSLTGRWTIDFTGPEYAADGIFAITGPTGAGKTTILDAICLGLYGRTPRLDRVTKTANEIMSRQTGECFAEVTFETQMGRFRSHWSQHRARKKPEGELQPARHEVADAATGTVLESKLSRVGTFIEEATGLNYDRFIQSMMLAQGDFAAFLAAKPDERSPILEQITGTEIYSRISMKVHERRRAEQEKLGLLKAKLEGIEILTPEQVVDLETNLTKLRPEENTLNAGLEELRKAAHWLEGIKVLEKEKIGLDSQLVDLDRRRQAFAPDLSTLKEAIKALDLEGDYQAVKGLRTQQKEDVEERSKAVALMPEKEKVLSETLANKTRAEKTLANARSARQVETPAINKARELDVRIQDRKDRIGEEEKSLVKCREQIEKHEKDNHKLDKKKENTKSELDAVDAYLADNAQDEALVGELVGIKETFGRLRDVEAKLAGLDNAISTAVAKKAEVLKQSNSAQSTHDNSARSFEQNEVALKKLTEEIEVLLQGRDLGKLRDEAAAIRERGHLLKQARDTVQRAEDTRTAIAGLNEEIENNLAVMKLLSGDIETSKGQQAQIDKDISGLEKEVLLRSRIRDLEDERLRLEDGRPCPLCGAPEHPYARGNVPELDRAQTDLKDKKAEFDSIARNLGRMEKKAVKTETNIQNSRQAIKGKRTEIEKDETLFREILLRIDLQVPPEQSITVIDGEIAETNTKLSDISEIIETVEEKTKKERRARTTLEKDREERDGLFNTLRDARHQLEKAELEHDRLAKELDAAKNETEKARSAALARCQPFGIETLSGTDLDTVFNDLSQRKKNWAVQQESQATLQKEVSVLSAGIEQNSAVMARIETDRQTREEAIGSLVKERAGLAMARKEMFGAKDPDREAARLAKAEETAGVALEKEQETLARIKTKKLTWKAGSAS
jgi:DNA repair protein SbcC/Rad50